MELDVELFPSDEEEEEEGNIGLDTDTTTYDFSDHESDETDDESLQFYYSDDYSDNYDHSSYWNLYPDEWWNLPVGMYDPFDPSFPRNSPDMDWGTMATQFIYSSLQTYKDWNPILDFICEPFSDWEGIYLRTRNWFNSLEFDVQMEIWIQRNLGLRPRSKWILGPHDELLDEWMTRYEMGKCRILDVSFPGMELGYALTSGDNEIVED